MGLHVPTEREREHFKVFRSMRPRSDENAELQKMTGAMGYIRSCSRSPFSFGSEIADVNSFLVIKRGGIY